MPRKKYLRSEQASSLCPRPCTYLQGRAVVHTHMHIGDLGLRDMRSQRVVGRELEPRVVGRAVHTRGGKVLLR